MRNRSIMLLVLVLLLGLILYPPHRDPQNPSALGSEPNLIEVANARSTDQITRDVKILGNISYVSNGIAGVSIYNISDPLNPLLISQFITPGSAYSIVVDGIYMFIADGSAGLQIYNVSDLMTPFLISTYESPDVRGVAVNGNRVYLNDEIDRLRVLDISNIYSPKYIGHNIHSTRNGPVLDENFIYHVGYDGFTVFNVTPDYPVKVGNVGGLGLGWRITMNNSFAFVSDGQAGVKVIDVRNKTSPVIVSNYDSISGVFDVVDIEVEGKFAYLMSRRGDLEIVDFSNFASPVLAGSYNRPYFNIGEDSHTIDKFGNYTFVANGLFGMKLLNVSDFSKITKVWDINDVNDDIVGFDVADGYLYTANSREGMNIFRLDTSGPVLVSTFLFYDLIYDFYLSDGYVYFATYSQGLIIVNATDPTNPQYIGQYITGSTMSKVFVHGSYAYVTKSTDLLILDISDPSSPTQVGIYTSSASYNNFFHDGKLLYAATQNLGVIALNVSNPSVPNLVGSISTNAVYDLAIKGNYAYLAHQSLGMTVVDISDPSSMSQVGTYSQFTGSRIYLDYYMYLGGNGKDISVLDPAVPTSLIKITQYNTTAPINDIATYGPLVLIGGGTAGVKILHWYIPPTTVTATNTVTATDTQTETFVSNKSITYTTTSNYTTTETRTITDEISIPPVTVTNISTVVSDHTVTVTENINTTEEAVSEPDGVPIRSDIIYVGLISIVLLRKKYRS